MNPLEALAAPYRHNKPDSSRTPHLLCGSRFWPLSCAIGCLYLAWLAYSHLASGQIAWPSDVWSILAYSVWILFLLVLTTETRCFRERLLFAILVGNFLLGLGMAAAPVIQFAATTARQISLILWLVGAFYSISFIIRPVPATSQKP